jgi:V8-like Glu-specific endopeptidase
MTYGHYVNPPEEIDKEKAFKFYGTSLGIAPNEYVWIFDRGKDAFLIENLNEYDHGSMYYNWVEDQLLEKGVDIDEITELDEHRDSRGKPYNMFLNQRGYWLPDQGTLVSYQVPGRGGYLFDPSIESLMEVLAKIGVDPDNVDRFVVLW